MKVSRVTNVTLRVNVRVDGTVTKEGVTVTKVVLLSDIDGIPEQELDPDCLDLGELEDALEEAAEELSDVGEDDAARQAESDEALAAYDNDWDG